MPHDSSMAGTAYQEQLLQLFYNTAPMLALYLAGKSRQELLKGNALQHLATSAFLWCQTHLPFMLSAWNRKSPAQGGSD